MDEAKREFVRNWLLKAERDLLTARKLASPPERYLDTAIYHCQQAAEKAIKGFLIFHDRRFKKTHDLELLVSMALPYAEGFAGWRAQAKRLNPYVGKFRYIEDLAAELEPAEDEFLEALRAAEGLYAFVLSLLPKEAHP